MPTEGGAEARLEIGAGLARRLVDAQFPQWRDLPVRAVPASGWGNATFRLGTGLKLRLPTAARYAAQPAKEERWLPALAPHLPVAIPAPIGLGKPSEGYPWSWAVQTWLAGAVARPARIGDGVRFARDLASFLVALRAVDPGGGPPAGAHSFHRGGALAVYDAEARACIATLGAAAGGAAAVWAALASRRRGPAVWVHGDVAAGNLLARAGRLTGVIDFGCCAVGDPACDLTIAWTLFEGAGRAAFREAAAADAATWARARGWALWKAALTLADGGVGAASARRVVAAVLAEAG